MRYPKFLPKGGTIGFLAPSFGFARGDYRTEAFESAVKKWRGMGYELLFGPNCYASDGIGISTAPEKCAREVMDMFLSGKADCLISCGGGELMCEILPYVDFDALAEAVPLWFMGYSDNSNLTYLLATLADTASVYGPCAGTFGMEPWHESLYDAFGLLTGERGDGAGCVVKGYELWEKESVRGMEHPLAPYNLTEKRQLRLYQGQEKREEADFKGRLLGGCMDCLVNLLGTRFDKTKEFVERYREDGVIWFLEACDLNVFAIRRAMWQMEEAGWLQHVKGFLFGRPLNGESVMNLDACGAVMEVAGRKNVPVVLDVDLGHLPPMMPLVTGSLAEVAVRGNDIRIQMKYL